MTQKEGTGAHLLLGVRTRAATFRPAELSLKETNGRTYRVVVPSDTAVKLEASSAGFALGDERGDPFAGRGIGIPIFAASGQAAPIVRLSVLGGQ